MSAHDEWAKGREGQEQPPDWTDYLYCQTCGDRFPKREDDVHVCWSAMHPVVARLERLEAKLDKIPTPETVMVNGILVPKVANIVDVTLKPAIFHGEDRELLERIEAKLERL